MQRVVPMTTILLKSHTRQTKTHKHTRQDKTRHTHTIRYKLLGCVPPVAHNHRPAHRKESNDNLLCLKDL